MHGVRVERGVRLAVFDQDGDGVTASLSGADGAHSTVRRGLAFEGAAFDERYMLGDVEVDWSMPRLRRPDHAPDRRRD
jgi:pentachlorophenol monooxygenase